MAQITSTKVLKPCPGTEAYQHCDWTDYLNLFDQRFEDYQHMSWLKAFFRDAMAGLIVALIAIPLGVGFSIASGLRPEQGIVAGAIAGLVGGLFGGSKYQVYGPTAAFITTLASITSNYDAGFLTLCTCLAGGIIVLMALGRLGRFFQWVPHAIIVGFTVGIALTIIASQLPEILGALHKTSPKFLEKMAEIPGMFADANGHTLFLGLLTFVIIRQLYQWSVYIPAPLIALGLCSYIANFIWHDKYIPLVSTKYGEIQANLFMFTPPSLGQADWADVIMPVLTLVFIAALESLLSARMADRLAHNPTPYNPNKELFGQGLVNVIVPLFNGFPCTGALARTATNIKVGALSPMASILKGVFVIVLMLGFSTQLNRIPMACVGGLLLFVALNMIKLDEIRQVVRAGYLHVALMAYTAAMTLISDLFIAVSTATLLYLILSKLGLGSTKPNIAPSSLTA